MAATPPPEENADRHERDELLASSNDLSTAKKCDFSEIPWFPTVHWLDLAAERLALAWPGTATITLLTELDAEHRIGDLQTCGCAGSVPLSAPAPPGLASDIHEWRCHFAHLSGSSFVNGAASTLPAAQVLSPPQWRTQPHASIWAALGEPNVLAAAAWIDEARRTAALFYIASPGELAPADARAALSAIAALCVCARRAFGHGPFNQTRFLTVREYAIFLAVVKGLTESQIAAEMQRSPHTIRDAMRSVYLKLGVKSRTDLLRRVQIP
ncbi:MAG: hypothetical protein JSR77_02150 [Planctomycetes bacterium]|nr:hypothetical protein [Planctomycetota bacterium]